MSHTASGSFKNLTANSSLIKMSIGLLVPLDLAQHAYVRLRWFFSFHLVSFLVRYRVKMVKKNRCEIRKLHLGCLAPKEYLLFLT